MQLMGKASFMARLGYAALFLLLVAILSLIGLRFYITRPISCTPTCIGISLPGRDLRGMNLAGAKLMEANLQGVDLSEANLRQADLSGADLSYASLRNTDLSEARLIGVNLTGADLGGAQLSGVNLNGSLLDYADLTSVDLTEVALSGSSFIGAQLTDVLLNRAKIDGLQFTSANLSGADLSFAKLSGANLSGANMSGAILHQVDLTGAWLNLTNLTGVDLSQADLSGSRLIGGALTSADLSGSNLKGASVVGANLNGANLRGADLRRIAGKVEQLGSQELTLDPVLAELNMLQRSAILQDVNLKGVEYNNLTLWTPELQPANLGETADGTTSIAQLQEQQLIANVLPTTRLTKINFFINALRNLPAEPDTFEVDFYVDILWNEEALEEHTLAEASEEELFDPLVEVTNGTHIERRSRRYDASLEPNTNLRLRQRIIGLFTPPMDLGRFPFDEQTVSIQLESAEFNSDQLLFDFVELIEPIVHSEIPYVQHVPRGRYVDAEAIDPGWIVREARIMQKVNVLPHDNSSWSQFRIELVIQRMANGYLWRLLGMLALLWLSAGAPLLVNRQGLHLRLWLLFVLFWLTVAYQAVLTHVLPALEAFTLLDLYLLCCYGALVAMVLVVLAIQWLTHQERLRWARWLNNGAIVLHPLLFILGNVGFLWNIFG